MKCAYCLVKEVESENPRAKFCSDSCRVQYSRKNSKKPVVVGDAPDTSDVEKIAMEESYDVPGVNPFWTKPHKLVFHSNSEWRGCCVGPDKWEARCPRTGDVVTAGSYAEMMRLAREKAREHISEEVAHPHWTARMPQSVKPPKELDRSKSQLAGGKAQPKGGES